MGQRRGQLAVGGGSQRGGAGSAPIVRQRQRAAQLTETNWVDFHRLQEAQTEGMEGTGDGLPSVAAGAERLVCRWEEGRGGSDTISDERSAASGVDKKAPTDQLVRANTHQRARKTARRDLSVPRRPITVTCQCHGGAPRAQTDATDHSALTYTGH